MAVTVVRPAAICGFSPRMRLEVAVNQLTKQALTTGEIKVFGGQQLRPNIHIEDVTDAYIYLLGHPLQGIYNVTDENIKVSEIARSVADLTGAKIVRTDSDDKRSYQMSGAKLDAAGWRASLNIETAIQDLREQWESGNLKDEDRWYNLRTMKCA